MTEEVRGKSKRGGARPGAGRKLGSGEGLTSKLQVCVTPEQKEAFEALGGARWLRKLIERERLIQIVPDTPTDFGHLIGDGAKERTDQEVSLVPPGSLFPRVHNHVNGNGHANGSANGFSNGHANGANGTNGTNGINGANGHANGNGKLNGSSNGHQNGAANGNGHANGNGSSLAGPNGYGEVDFNSMLVPMPESAIVVRARNNDMLGAGIAQGDLIVVDRSVPPETGKVVLMRMESRYLVRRLIMNGPRSEFHVDSGKIDPVIPETDDDWQLVGVVTGLVRTMR